MLRILRLALMSAVILVVLSLCVDKANASEFVINNPKSGDVYQKTSPIACNGTAKFLVTATIKLVLNNGDGTTTIVDEATITSGGPPNGAWSHTFQSTAQNPYPAGNYDVQIWVNGGLDTQVTNITLE